MPPDSQTPPPEGSQAQQENPYSVQRNIGLQDPIDWNNERAFIDQKTNIVAAVPKEMSDQEAAAMLDQSVYSSPSKFKPGFYEKEVVPAIQEGAKSIDDKGFQTEAFLKNAAETATAHIYKPSDEESQMYDEFAHNASLVGQMGGFATLFAGGTALARAAMGGLASLGAANPAVGAFIESAAGLEKGIVARLGLTGKAGQIAAGAAGAGTTMTGYQFVARAQDQLKENDKLIAEGKDPLALDYVQILGDAGKDALPWALAGGIGASIARPIIGMTTLEATGQKAKELAATGGTLFTIMKLQGANNEDAGLAAYVGVAMHAVGVVDSFRERQQVLNGTKNGLANYLIGKNSSMNPAIALEVADNIINAHASEALKSNAPVTIEQPEDIAEAKEGADTDTDMQQRYKDVYDSLLEAGRPQEEADKNALIAASFKPFPIQGETNGEWWARVKPDIFSKEYEGDPLVKAWFTNKDGRNTIYLSAQANATSFGHEFTHLYVSELEKAIETGAIRGQDTEDFNKLKEWAGFKEGQEGWRDSSLTREQHEKIAKGFETYVQEGGKSPTPEVQGAFDKLARWFRDVYRSLGKQKIKISQDVREIFDSWFNEQERPYNRAALEKETARQTAEGLARKILGAHRELPLQFNDPHDPELLDYLAQYLPPRYVAAMEPADRLALANSDWRILRDFSEEINNPTEEVEYAKGPGTEAKEGGQQPQGMEPGEEERLRIRTDEENRLEAEKRKDLADIQDIQDWLNASEGPQTVKTADGGYKRLPSGWPSFLSDRGHTSKELNNLFQKSLKGTKLTEKQQTKLDTIISDYRALKDAAANEEAAIDKDLSALREQFPEITDKEIQDVFAEIEQEDPWNENKLQEAIKRYSQTKAGSAESEGGAGEGEKIVSPFTDQPLFQKDEEQKFVKIIPVELFKSKDTKSTAEEVRKRVVGSIDEQIVRMNQWAASFKKAVPEALERQAAFAFINAEGKIDTLKAKMTALENADKESTLTEQSPDYAAEVKKVKEYYASIKPILERAMNLKPETMKWVKEASQYFAESGRTAKDIGSIRNALENYMTNRLYQPEPPEDFIAAGKRLLNPNTPHSKQRFYPTIYDAILAGKRIATWDLADNVSVHNEEMTFANVSKMALDEAVDKDIVAKISPEQMPSGFQRVGSMSDNGKIYVAPKPMAEGLAAITDPNTLRQVKELTAVNKLNGFVKSFDVALSFFHHYQFVKQALSSKNGEKILGSFFTNLAKGVDPFESQDFKNNEQYFASVGLRTSMRQANFDIMADLNKVPGGLLDKLRENPGVAAGLKVVDANNHLLFDYMQRYFKVMTMGERVSQWNARNLGIDEQTVAVAHRGIARAINNTFGGLNWEMLGITKSQQAILRLGLFAPDWLLSAIIHTKDAAFDWRGLKGSQGTAGNISRGNLIKGILYGTAITQLMNRLTTGHWMQDNKHGHRFEWQAAPGVYVNNYGGATGEFIKAFSNMVENGPVKGAGRYLQAKEAPLMRLGTMALTGRNYAGQDIYSGDNAITKTANGLLNMAATVTPIPFGALGTFQYALKGEATPLGMALSAAGVGRFSPGSDAREEMLRNQEIKNEAFKGNTKPLEDAYARGDISDRRYEMIQNEMDMTPLERKTRPMSLPKLIEFMNKTSSENRKELQDLLDEKFDKFQDIAAPNDIIKYEKKYNDLKSKTKGG